MKVLFHIDQSENWDMLLNNVTNMFKYGESTSALFEIEIVVNGAAVNELQAEEAEKYGIRERFLPLVNSVHTCACNNALKNLGISLESLLPFVQVVPVGVVEIATKQQQGYSYIKP